MTTTSPTEAGAGFSAYFISTLARTTELLDVQQVDQLAARLALVRDKGGRVFVLGLGGSAANASHAACDLRGLANLEAYAPTDMPGAFTAAANDYGWRQAFVRCLATSRLGPDDAVMVLSVGGGSEDPLVSENLVEAIHFTRSRSAFLCGVVGPQGGETARLADLCIRVPVVDPALRTTHTEILQAAIWHLLVTHPLLNKVTPRWESLSS